MVSGRLAVSADKLRFDGADVLIELSIDGLQLSTGGHNDEQLFFEHAAQPNWILTTSDHSMLGALAEVADPALRERIRSATRRKSSVASRFVMAAVVVLALMIGSVALLYSQKSRFARMAASHVPASVEEQFGDAMFKSLQPGMKITTDARWKAQLEPVMARLVPAATNSGYKFRFHVAEADDLNAFAVPGGHIVVHTGLLKAVKRPEELAGVLAHEMAHVSQRHSLRNVIEALGLTLVMRLLFGDASGLVALASEGSETLLRQKFSRDTEREADETGWDLLVSANIDPRGMIDFFRTMRSELEKNPATAAADGRLSFLSTHPATAERIERLEARWKALPAGARFMALPATPDSLEKPSAQ